LIHWTHLPSDFVKTGADSSTKLQAAFRSLSFLFPLKSLARLGITLFFFYIVKELRCREPGEAEF